MKLVRFGAPGHERPGILAADGTMRDLSGIVADIDADTLSPAGLQRLAMGMQPPRFLNAGAVMTLGITGLGQQHQLLVAFGERAGVAA